MKNELLNHIKDNPQGCFTQAIKEGRLSTDPQDNTFAGNYMYMGTEAGIDLFKNIITRKYDV